MNKIKLMKQIFALLMVMMTLLNFVPITVLAEGTEKTTVVIHAFGELTEQVRKQSVPYGTEISELYLPESLTAIASVDETVNIADVKWVSSPDYKGDVPGSYTFLAVLPAEYSLAEGVSMPEVSVTVEEETQENPPLKLMNSPVITSVTTAEELNNAFQSGGQAVLNMDIALSAPLVVAQGKNVTLDLNGKKIDRGLTKETAQFYGNVITVKGNLTIEDSQGTGIITGGARNAYTGGGGVYVDGGTFTFKSGRIVGNTAKGYGGGVFVESGTFNMNGGTISGNTTSGSGGGVCVNSGCSFTISNGEIMGNTATGSGGGVYADGGSFIMDNGTISGNTAVGGAASEGYGGGVSVMHGGSLIMSAGEIRGNTAQGYSTMAGQGGGVYVDMSGSFTMKGGIISSNEAEHGGGVYLTGNVYPSVGTVSSFTMSAGQISENTTDSSSKSGYGGGVYVTGGTLSISSGSKIIANSAATGGGIYMLGGTCSMENSEISNNSTFGSMSCNGGGINLAGGNFTMNSGKINNNKATNGGGVYIFGGVFTMKDGQINENTAYVLENQMCDGGGVYLSKDGTFNMEGGEIRGNATSSWNMYNHGGGVYVYGGVFKVSGAISIIDNNRSGIPNNVYLKTDASKIEVTGALTGGTIGISTSIAAEGTKTLLVVKGSGIYAISDTDNNKFISDIGGDLKVEGNTIVLSKPSSSYLIFLSYNANGGSGTLGSSAILEGMDNHLTVASGNSFSRTNCSFAGWNTKADGSGIAYQPGDKLVLTADTALYSQWRIDKTELTLTPPNGGAIPSTSVACVPSGITAVVSWKHDGESLTGNFDYNTAYSVEITLTTGSGCIFANTPEVKINGQSAAIQSRSDTVMVVNFTFSKTGPRSKPTAVLSPIVKDVANTGGTRLLTLNVAGISEGCNPVTWTMSKTDGSNILNMPSTTEGTLSNGTLDLGSIVIDANEVGQPAKSASVTITFGGNKDGEYAGVPASITVIFQLGAGAAPDATLDFVNEKITGVTAGMEYLIDGSTSSPDDWTGATLVTGTEISLSGIIPEAGLSTKYIHIRLKDIIGSVSTTIAITARPDLVTIFGDWDSWVVHNIVNDVELGYVYWDFSYRINNGADMLGSSESCLEIPLKPGDTLTFWKPASTSSFKSAEITVTAPARIKKPNVAIDFEKEILSTTESMQYRLSSENNWTNCTADMATSKFGWDGTAAVNIQLRYPSTDEYYASEAQILTIPPYPAMPVISYTSTTTTITITAETGVRYRLNGGEWKIADGNGKVVFNGLTTNQSYTVDAQKLATESSFQSKEASLSVSTKSLDDGMGSVSMANWTYGDMASEPVPVSTTNGTGSVTYSYAGTKADGTVYSSSIKPTDAGSYTVVATFAATSNYKSVTSKIAQFTIFKKDIDVQWTEQHYVYDGTEKAATYSLPDLEIGDAGNVSVSIGSGQRTSAGFQRVSASLVGSRAFNYALTNPIGNLIIQRAPVTFTVGNNSICYNGHPQAVTITAVVNGSTFKEFAVNYKRGGTVVLAPTDVGIYDIYASFNNTNYRHANGADGAERKIGVLVIFEQTPVMYKTSFAPGKGSGTIDSMIDAVAGTVRILPNCTFDAGEQGYVFAGWKLDDKLYPAGAAFDQPARDVSFTAQWVPYIHSVSGTVRQNGTTVKGTVMTLMNGSQQVAETVTDSHGIYQFNNVIPGFYNLIGTKDGVIVTVKIEVKTADLTGVDIILPIGKTNSVVEVLAGTPAITVGNLENIFEWQDGVVFTNADQAAVNAGGTVEIRITAEVVAENLENSDQKKIVDKAGGSNPSLYLEMRLSKSLTSEGSTVETPLTASNTLLEIVVPLTPELQGKDSYIVYRYHNDEVQMLTTTQNSKGEYIKVNADKTSITIYAKLFSTYAIGYTIPTSQGNGNVDNGSASIDCTITATAGDGGRISPNGTVSVLKGDSITFEVTPDKGNAISDVLVDGVSVGAVSRYTFLDIKTMHSIKAVFAGATGLPYYLDADGKKVFIGFSSDASGNMKYIAPKDEPVLFSQNPKNFTDIGNHWAKSSIDFITQREIFQGTGKGMFSPDTGMTRGMFATVIGRLYESSYGMLNPSESTAFTDIEADAFYAKYVIWAEKNGIIKGVGGGKFGPNLSITREEMALLLYRFARFMEVPETEILGIKLSYSDTSEISSWAIDAAKYCQKTNLIAGCGNARFAPKKTATRAEVAVILQRYIKTMVY